MGHGVQDGPAQVGQHMKLADLVRDGPENGRNRRWIQVRAVGGHGLDRQLPGGQARLKALKKGQYIRLGGIVIKHLIVQPLEDSIVHQRHAEGAQNGPSYSSSAVR